MAGYTRQSIADIINGADITAPPLNAEFDQLASAFDSATGHSHDGTSGNSPKIDLTTSVTGYLPAIHGGIGGKNNFAATTNPTVTDDSVAGYAPGSMWENTSTGRIFICVGNTSGSAVWRELVQVETSNKIEPIAHDSIDLGTPTVRFQDIYLSGSVSAATNISAGGTLNVTGLSTLASLNVTGATTLDGNITLGNTTLDNITFTGRVASDVVPNGAYDLGSPTQEWTDLFIDGIAHIDTLDVDENAGIDGNLSVTGNTTLTGTLGVTGDVTVANLTATGTSAITSIDVASGAIDSTTIGNSIAADGTFVNLTASTSLTAATADINGGTLDGVTIGGTSSAPATVTNLTATGTSTLSTVDINGGAIDGTTIGATNHTTGKFTTLQSTGLATLNSVNIDGGNIDGTAIGSTTTSSGAFTTLSASSGITGNLTGDVQGDLQGNVTGNVQGNLTGNVTASTGSSTFNNVTINGTLNMDAATTATITNLSTPVASGDAASKGYVDTQVANLVDSAPGTLDTLNELAAALGDDPNFSTTITNSIATKLPLAGGTMTGAIAMGTNKITGLGDPTAAQDAATQNYVTTNFLGLSGGTMTGAVDMGSNKVTSSATPSTGNDLTNKTYVDGVLGSATAASASAAAAATSENNAATSASSASNSATAAAGSATSAAASLSTFQNQYLGAQSSAPTQDPDGSALDTGDLYFDTTTDTMKVYGSSGWVNAGSSVNGTSDRQTYTAYSGQTVFAATYDAGYVDVYLNGVKLLAGTDFTAVNGTSIVLASGAAVNDIVDIVAYGTFVLADHLTETQSDAKYVELAGDTMTGGLTIQPASVGAFTPNAAADDLVVENNGNAGITIVSPDANYSGLIFASATDPTGSIIEFNYDNATLDLGTATSGGVLRLRSGNFTEAAQFDASGNFIVGNTFAPSEYVTTSTNEGFAYQSQDYLVIARNGGSAIHLNRLGSDGNIAEFRKDGTTVGSIASNSGYLKINSGNPTYGSGIEFHNLKALPVGANGASSNGTVSLGESGRAWKDLHLLGVSYSDSLQFIQNSVSAGAQAAISRPATNTLAFYTNNGSERMRIDSDGVNYIKSASAYKNKYEDHLGNQRGYIWNNGTEMQFDSQVSQMTIATVDTIRLFNNNANSLYINTDGEMQLRTNTDGGGSNAFAIGKGLTGYMTDGNGSTQASIKQTRTIGTGGGTTSGNGWLITTGNNTYTGYPKLSDDPTVNIAYYGTQFVKGGIYFGGTTGATPGSSGASNRLDDYEEGTWTPTVLYGGSDTGQSYSIRTSRYTKIGRVVYYSAYIQVATNSSATGVLSVGGLPYASATGSNLFWTGTAGFDNASSNVDQPVGRVANGTTEVQLFTGNNTNNWAIHTDSIRGSAFRVLIAGHYETN